MRAWGLAKGLKKHGVEVTVAINASFPQERSDHDGIKLINWSPNEEFARLINLFDAVIISYCMGSDSVFVANNINDDVQLILDAYVPIYVEVSAREAIDLDSDYTHYMEDVSRYNHVLKRGDYFLCASETQKIYYTGVLSSLGIINPRSYRQNRIITAPFGIHRDEPSRPTHNPYKKLGIKDSDFLILWFGGLYPWFRVDEYLQAVKELSSDSRVKFAIVGGKNPFNPNPDFSKQYDRALEFAKTHQLLDSSLFFIDWVDFDDRINWYGRADLVISINQPGEENALAWRTRVMDFVWGDLPILTNGGDPLSEDLLAGNAAMRLEDLSKESMVGAIKDFIGNKQKISSIKESLATIKEKYYWDNIVKPIITVIDTGDQPNPEESQYRKRLGVMEPSVETSALSAAEQDKLKKYLRLSRKSLSYAKRHGLKRSAHLAYRIGRAQLEKRTRRPGDKKYAFISHPIDNSGAPLVLLKMVEEFAEKFGASNIKLVAPGILPHHLQRLKAKGIKVDKAALALDDRLIDLQLGLDKDDFLLINTLAVYPNYRGFVLRALASRRINHAYWFIHEDTAQIPLVARELMDDKETAPITDLANKGRLTLVAPSKKVQQDYIELWKTKNVNVLPLNVDVPAKYKKPRPASDYTKINFLLSGNASDARKGQLLAISAFYSFMQEHYQKSPDKYRDFSLTLVSIANDYVSQQIKIIGKLLGKKLKIFPSMPYAESLEITSKCNAVICCSLNETFALYVAEGMYMGHVLLRNDSAGMEEQLKDGVNGFYVETGDIKQFVSTIDKMLDKKISNEKLQKMGRASQEIIKPYATNSYLSILDIK